MLDTVNCWTQYFAEHGNMEETVICWSNCILDIWICATSFTIYQVLNDMPSKCANYEIWTPFRSPFEIK